MPHASRVSDRRALTAASFSAPGVILETRLEAGDVGTRLHLTITPAPNVRLAAGPGIIVSALQGPVRWLAELPAVRKSSGDYFTEPQEFVLGFLPNGASTVSLKVDYAYCPTPTTCLLSSKAIDVPID